jgi:UDP-N-acetyl-2-amino-2-deoxyglucuronate dehydrogenase
VTVHVGILGGGNISETHARAALEIPGVRIAAVHGANRDKLAALAALCGAPAYDRFDDFLAHRPMDLVAIGSPSGLHATQGIAAARSGLHVLVEKPLDIALDASDALIAAADEAGVKLGVFFQDRFKPDLVRLKGLLDEGRLGRPLLVDARVPWYRPPEYYAASRWRGTWALDGGGALMNQGIHTVDLLIWFMGGVRRVQSLTTAALHAIEVEDTAAALLEFDSGALGVLLATTAAYPGYARRIQVTGSNGTALVEGDRLVSVDLRVVRGEAGTSDSVSGREPRAAGRTGPAPASASSPVVADTGPHRAVFEDFLEAIRAGRPPRCDGRDARRSVALVRAIYDAARHR